MLLENDISDVQEFLEDKIPDGKLLLAEVNIGEDAAQFVRSELGRYIIGQADIEILEATRELKVVWPWRKRRIQALQNEIKVREMFKFYLLAAINTGKSALGELTNREAEAE